MKYEYCNLKAISGNTKYTYELYGIEVEKSE